jgi:hypothetical protein
VLRSKDVRKGVVEFSFWTDKAFFAKNQLANKALQAPAGAEERGSK